MGKFLRLSFYYSVCFIAITCILVTDCVGKEFDWNALRKQEFDNMSDYLAAIKQTE